MVVQFTIFPIFQSEPREKIRIHCRVFKNSDCPIFSFSPVRTCRPGTSPSCWTNSRTPCSGGTATPRPLASKLNAILPSQAVGLPWYISVRLCTRPVVLLGSWPPPSYRPKWLYVMPSCRLPGKLLSISLLSELAVWEGGFLRVLAELAAPNCPMLMSMNEGFLGPIPAGIGSCLPASWGPTGSFFLSHRTPSLPPSLAIIDVNEGWLHKRNN